MAHDRMIRATTRYSETVNSWPYELRWFWTQLWGYCDDWGRGRRDPRLVKAGVAPIDDEATVQVVDGWMIGLELAGVIQLYKVAGKPYFEVVNWDEHQPLTYRKRTDVPGRDGVIPPAGKSDSGSILKSSGTFQKIPSEGEGEGEVEKKGEHAPPTPFCKKHPGGTEQPCRACGNARRAFEAARDQEAKRPTPTPPRGKPDPKSCQHKYVAGWCVAGCEQAEP